MLLKQNAIALTLAAVTAAPVPAFGITCFDLPEYARAVGTLQGLSTCDMTIEQARRVVAAQGGQTYQQVAPAPQVRHRHHQVRKLQE